MDVRPVERGLPGAGYSRRRLMPSEPGHYSHRPLSHRHPHAPCRHVADGTPAHDAADAIKWLLGQEKRAGRVGMVMALRLQAGSGWDAQKARSVLRAGGEPSVEQKLHRTSKNHISPKPLFPGAAGTCTPYLMHQNSFCTHFSPQFNLYGRRTTFSDTHLHFPHFPCTHGLFLPVWFTHQHTRGLCALPRT